jgi:hypothetical protein
MKDRKTPELPPAKKSEPMPSAIQKKGYGGYDTKNTAKAGK